MPSDPPGWLVTALVILALLVLMAVLGLLRARRRLGAETSRKLLHIAMGLTAASFPWVLLDDGLWVALCAALCALIVLMARRVPRLRRSPLGAAIHEVGRQSYGELFFALAIALLFSLAADRPPLYVASVLALTFGDAAAALAGTAYGRHRYRTLDGWKSWEGSLALVAASLPAVLLPLVLLGEIPIARALPIAAIAALSAVTIESFAPYGLDNIALPLGVYLVLVLLLNASPEQVTADLVVILCLTAVAGLLVWRYPSRTRAVMAATLAGVLFCLGADQTWARGGLTPVATAPETPPRVPVIGE